MKQVNVKKLILPNIPYVFIALLATNAEEWTVVQNTHEAIISREQFATVQAS